MTTLNKKKNSIQKKKKLMHTLMHGFTDHVEFWLYSKPSLFVLREDKNRTETSQSVKDPSIIKPNLQYVPIYLIRVHGKPACVIFSHCISKDRHHTPKKPMHLINNSEALVFVHAALPLVPSPADRCISLSKQTRSQSINASHFRR